MFHFFFMVMGRFICSPVALTSSKSVDMRKRNVNETLKYHLVCKHRCLSHAR